MENFPLTLPSLIAFIFAFISVEIYFLSPLYFVFKYERKYIERKNIPFAQIFLNTLNCLIYVLFSLLGTGNIQNLITNLIGLIICLIVLLKLRAVISKNKENDYFFYAFFVFNITFQIFYFFNRIYNEIGILSIILNILMYLSLNQNDLAAYRENAPEKIPVFSCIMGFLSCIFWTLYSYFLPGEEGGIQDLTTFISNSFGCLVVLVPIIEYFYLKKKVNRGNVNKNKEIDNSKSDNNNINNNDNNDNNNNNNDNNDNNNDNHQASDN